VLIRNRNQLVSSSLRKKALAIIEAGLASIDTKKIIHENLTLKKNFLFIKDAHYDLDRYRQVFLVAVGKSALSASCEIGEILGKKLKSGVVLSLKEGKVPKMEVFSCTHPAPSEQNVKATIKAQELLESVGQDDLLIVVVSGGGSSMLTAPYKISISEKASVAKVLMSSGATIEELNTVRKHLSLVKGGRLAELAYPATIVTLIFSDVATNNLSTIASGPTVMDHTTNGQARAILDKYKVQEVLKLPKLDLSETPKETKFFHKVQHLLLVDNSVALNAMVEQAGNLGFAVEVYSRNLEGEARKVGKTLLQQSKKNQALLAAGETTVHVEGSGKGGRCQELVLGSLENLRDNQVLVAIGTDGHDNSDFAGAIADTSTLKKAAGKALDYQTFLKNNDSFNFFKKVGDGIETGPLPSNVADLMLVLTS